MRNALPDSKVVLIGNPKVELLQAEAGPKFGLKGLDATTRQGLERALQLEREGLRVRVLLVLDHPRKGLQAHELFDQALPRRKIQQRLDSPHCDDLHPDIRQPIETLLAGANFPKDRLGILLERTVFQTRKQIFPTLKNCEVVAATTLSLASRYIFNPVRREMQDTYIASPVEVFLSPEGGMDEGHLVAARKYFDQMGFVEGLIIKGSNL